MRRSGSPRGFTMLELLMAMSIFSMLGLLVVVLMRQGMTIYTQGQRSSILQDRMDTVLPQVERSLRMLALPASFEAPPPVPTEEEALEGVVHKPPPPVGERVRATWIRMRDVPEGPLRDYPCYYAAWVTDISGNRSDPILREAGARTGPDLVEITPATVDAANANTAFKPSGGLMEVCYIAMPEDPDFPALLTLYYGWRSPVGGEGTLLDEGNLDTIAKVQAKCRPIAEGILYFGAIWRRVFAESWDLSPKGGEPERYVGHAWDSTRAFDKTFPLFKDPTSLGDPSDDIFPAWVRLEISLVAPTLLGYGRGETYLVESVNSEDRIVLVADATNFIGPGPKDRHLKVGGEWMRYEVDKVEPRRGRIFVERGQRGTKAVSHAEDADVYVGLASRRDLRLLYRDRYAYPTRSSARGRRGGR